MTVTAHEQLMIELVNRARLDPKGEADRLDIDSTAGMDLASKSADPLAGNPKLGLAADRHSSWMLSTDTFSHTGKDGSSAGDRIRDAGYTFSGSWAWGENIGFRGSSGTLDRTAAVYNLHRGLFESDGHRTNMLNPNFTEIGIGIQYGDYRGYDSAMATQNFTRSGGNVFLTGVSYTDRDGDDFYSVGEGQGGIKFSVGNRSADTHSAGGYSVEFGGTGWHGVDIKGGGVSAKIKVRFDGGNVKVDLVNKNTVQASSDLQLVSGVANAVLLGLDDLKLTGHSGANRLTGNDGDNAIHGQGGNDRIDGGDGDDTMTGGLGNDQLEGGRGDDVYDGGSGADSAIIDASSDEISVRRLSDGWIEITSQDGIDRFKSVETFVFRDETLSQADLFENSTSESGKISGFKWTGSDEGEVVTGSNGADTLKGNGGDDEIEAGGGNDKLYGGGGNDTIKGRAGDDAIDGGHGNDRVVGQGGRDNISGGEGADNLKGGGQEDELYGDGGSDFLKGGTADDKVRGGQGRDNVLGNGGDDNLAGGAGNDKIKGGGGSDRLEGGRGNDFLKGGAGSDEFVFNDGDGRDRINDFNSSRDTLVLDSDLVGPHTTGKEILKNYGSVSNGNVVLDFGDGDIIVLEGVSSMSGLADNIEII